MTRRLLHSLPRSTPAARCRFAPGSGYQVPATVDTLPNGLTVIVHEDHSAPIASVNIWYHTGSGLEKIGRTGFAHLFEHLMFMGSEHAPYPQFDRLLEAAGGDNNGSTTEDRTNYYENGPVNAVPLMLWLEADRMGWLTPGDGLGQGRRPARHREERAPAELREPAVRQGRGRDARPALPAGPSLLLAGDRLDGRPLGRLARGREGLLPEVLRAQQRHAHHRRRRQARLRAGAGAATVRQHSPWPRHRDARRCRR